MLCVHPSCRLLDTGFLLALRPEGLVRRVLPVRAHLRRERLTRRGHRRLVVGTGRTLGGTLGGGLLGGSLARRLLAALALRIALHRLLNRRGAERGAKQRRELLSLIAHVL